MKLTPWFNADVKPVRKGVYQREMKRGQGWYSYWNGCFWHGWADTPKRAHHNRHYGPSTVQDAPWRGLAEKP